MAKKRKNPVMIMAIVSVIIIVLGIACGVGVYYDCTNQLSDLDSGIYVDGADFSGLIYVLGQAGAFVISALIVAAGFLVVLIQWAVYFIVKLIKNMIEKKKGSPEYNPSNDTPRTYQ